jgi:hypothetical protein
LVLKQIELALVPQMLQVSMKLASVVIACLELP